jgi:signal peptidase II
MPKQVKFWLIVSAVVAVIDQLSKYLVVRTLARGESIEITSFFNLVLAYNSGAAFSFLAGADGWQRWLFAGIALGASAWILYLLYRFPQQRLFCVALALILGGALGNLVDRVLFGLVTDFLDFHAFGWHWPAFNIADSAITCGAALLLWEAFTSRPRTV